MTNRKKFCFGLAAALAFAAAPAAAQLYSWKDPATGQSRISNYAPPWYSRGEQVRGPRVIATVGDRVIDDTSLSYEARLRLAGKSDKQAETQPPQGQPGRTPPPLPTREAAGGRRDLDRTATR